MRKTIVSGRMMGRKDNVCAQMAVTSMTGFSGWQRDPPAARLYAVEPVGVPTQTPSARIEVKCSSSPNISVKDIALGQVSAQLAEGGRIARSLGGQNVVGFDLLGFGPLSTTTSFSTSKVPSDR